MSPSFLPPLLLKVAAGYSEVDTRRKRTMRQNCSQELTYENSYETLSRVGTVLKLTLGWTVYNTFTTFQAVSLIP